jgi:microcystin-dependent protein
MTRVIEIVRRGRPGADGASGVVQVLRSDENITLSSANRGFAIVADGAISAQLPPASGIGAAWSAWFLADSGAITLTSTSDINGSASDLVIPAGYSAQVVTDGTEYFVQFAIAEPILTVNTNSVGNESELPGSTLTEALDGLSDVAVSGSYDDLDDRPTASLVPPGAVMHFAMNAPPAGWLKANGAAVSRETYASLFAAIGTTFGTGDGLTTFNLPDLRGEFVRGWADDREVDTARVFGSAQGDALQTHTHGAPAFDALGGSGNFAYGGSTTLGDVYTTLMTGRTATETRPRNVALLACIKT